MSLLLDSIFYTVALGHLSVDILNGMRAVLLAYLSGPLGLTNAIIGLISTLCGLVAAFVQPFSGYVADRIGPRWVVTGGVLWMALFFGTALAINGPISLVFLVIASFGSGVFHPAGAMQAVLRGRSHYAGREMTAASYFFLFGELGFFFGPLLAGPLLDHFGPFGLLAIVSPALPVSLNAIRQLPGGLLLSQRPVPASNPAIIHPVNRNFLAVTAFIALATCFSWAQNSLSTFIPKYLSDQGLNASRYGLITAILMAGATVGVVMGGSLADRFGPRPVAVIALGLSSVPILLVPFAGLSLWLYLIIPFCGMLPGMMQSIVVVHAQRLIPGGRGLASGLILGLMFSAGAVGTYISGSIADLSGFDPVFRLTALLVLTGAVLAFEVFKKPAQQASATAGMA